jgi:hypothetical protein
MIKEDLLQCPEMKLPTGHPTQEGKDFSKCPMSKNAKTSKPAKKNTGEDSDSEDEAQRGGCPVMTSGTFGDD